MEKESSGKRKPFVPESGEYPNAFDAKAGIRRLMSSPNKTRKDILSVIIGVVESGIASQDTDVSDMTYQLIISLGSPQDKIETELFAQALRVLKKPSDEVSKIMSVSDQSGTMAALLLMSNKTSPNSTYVICEIWGLKYSTDNKTIRKRDNLIEQMRFLSNAEIESWDNEYTLLSIASIISKEGWFSSFSKTITEGFNSLPVALVGMIMNNAPASVKSIVAKKQSLSTKSADSLMVTLKSIANNEESVRSISRFMQSPLVSIYEKTRLYDHLVDHFEESGITPEARAAGLKLFAALPNQETFDTALEKFFEGSDKVSVKELTANFDFSILDYKAIMKKLNDSGMTDQADSNFVELAKSLEMAEHKKNEEIDAELESFMNDDYDNTRFASAAGTVIIGSNMGNNTAIFCAALLIAIGLPMSIVMSRTGTTGSELAARPDIVRRATEIAKAKDTSKEYAAIVERARQLASMPDPKQEASRNDLSRMVEPQSTRQVRPTEDQKLQAQDVNRQLVDAVITLEHVPGKTFSSKGAGGLMQLMPAVWEEINQKNFNGKYPFEQYVRNDWVNRKFGTIYLGTIKNYLDSHKEHWKTDQLPLMFACYFGGIGNIRKANFDPVKIKKYYPKTYDYMIRGSGLMGYDTNKL